MPGHPDKQFIEMVSSKRGTCKGRNGKDIIAVVDKYAPVTLNGEVYDATVRNSQCEIIISGAKCKKSISYRDYFRKAYHCWIKPSRYHPADTPPVPVKPIFDIWTHLRRNNGINSLNVVAEKLKEN